MGSCLRAGCAVRYGWVLLPSLGSTMETPAMLAIRKSLHVDLGYIPLWQS